MKNSKLILTVLLIIGGAMVAQAQKFRSGVKAGFNYSALYVEDVEDRSIRPGFHAGVFGQSQIGESSALQVELLYTTAGNRTTYSAGPIDGEVDFNLNYIQLPVLLNFKIIDLLEIHAGPYASYLINA